MSFFIHEPDKVALEKAETESIVSLKNYAAKFGELAAANLERNTLEVIAVDFGYSVDELLKLPNFADYKLLYYIHGATATS